MSDSKFWDLVKAGQQLGRVDEAGIYMPLTLLSKLGSIAVHADEMLSKDGHEFDRIALTTLLQDADVVNWLEYMSEMALVPKKR